MSEEITEDVSMHLSNDDEFKIPKDNPENNLSACDKLSLLIKELPNEVLYSTTESGYCLLYTLTELGYDIFKYLSKIYELELKLFELKSSKE